MTIRSRKKDFIKVIGIVIVIVLFLNIEMRPVQVRHSSIFTSPGNTEINLSVLMNTLLRVDEEKMVKDIIFKEQQLNGVRDNSVYTLKLYRSAIHYRNDWEYTSLTCDENGLIICEGDESVL